jgi:hypothetical protein
VDQDDGTASGADQQPFRERRPVVWKEISEGRLKEAG